MDYFDKQDFKNKSRNSCCQNVHDPFPMSKNVFPENWKVPQDGDFDFVSPSSSFCWVFAPPLSDVWFVEKYRCVCVCARASVRARMHMSMCLCVCKAWLSVSSHWGEVAGGVGVCTSRQYSCKKISANWVPNLGGISNSC